MILLSTSDKTFQMGWFLTMLELKTIKDIRDLQPCYDPRVYLPNDWSGTALDILQHEHIPMMDKVWVVRNWVGDRVNRLFAVWCARYALLSRPDLKHRLSRLVDVAEAYANGEASEESLSAAGSLADKSRTSHVGDAVSAACCSGSRRACYLSCLHVGFAQGDRFLYEAIGEFCRLCETD